MAKKSDFNFEYEWNGRKLFVVSLKQNNRNNFKIYFESLEQKARKKFIAIIKMMTDELGINISNEQKFKWLKKKYKGIGEVKIHNPGHRFLLTYYTYEKDFLILLLGFPKRDTQATKKVKQHYDKAKKLRNLILEDENELKKKLRKFL